MTHDEVASYNWDDGLDPIWPIVNSRETERATALLIFWRLEGPYMGAGSPFTAEAVRMNETVRSRLLSGFYSSGSLRYSPREDNGLTRTQIYKLEQAGCPRELILPSWED